MAGLEGLVDRLGPLEARVAAPPQFLSYGQDQVLDGGFGPGGDPWRAGAVVPVHPVEALASGPADPRMNGGLTDTEFEGDLVLRPTTSDGGDEGSAASGYPVTLLMTTSGEGCGFRSRLPPTDRDVVAQK